MEFFGTYINKTFAYFLLLDFFIFNRHFSTKKQNKTNERFEWDIGLYYSWRSFSVLWDKAIKVFASAIKIPYQHNYEWKWIVASYKMFRRVLKY